MPLVPTTVTVNPRKVVVYQRGCKGRLVVAKNEASLATAARRNATARKTVLSVRLTDEIHLARFAIEMASVTEPLCIFFQTPPTTTSRSERLKIVLEKQGSRIFEKVGKKNWKEIVKEIDDELLEERLANGSPIVSMQQEVFRATVQRPWSFITELRVLRRGDGPVVQSSYYDYVYGPTRLQLIARPSPEASRGAAPPRSCLQRRKATERWALHRPCGTTQPRFYGLRRSASPSSSEERFLSSSFPCKHSAKKNTIDSSLGGIGRNFVGTANKIHSMKYVSNRNGRGKMCNARRARISISRFHVRLPRREPEIVEDRDANFLVRRARRQRMHTAVKLHGSTRSNFYDTPIIRLAALQHRGRWLLLLSKHSV